MRLYNRWAGNPKGTAENPIRCVAQVQVTPFLSAQCQWKRGKGPGERYCGTHASMIARGRLPDVPPLTKERPSATWAARECGGG